MEINKQYFGEQSRAICKKLLFLTSARKNAYFTGI